jgi:hypothetical protein
LRQRFISKSEVGELGYLEGEIPNKIDATPVSHTTTAKICTQSAAVNFMALMSIIPTPALDIVFILTLPDVIA